MFEYVEEMLMGCADLLVDVDYDLFDVVVRDFAGFDDDWDEIMRDYDEEAVESVYAWLEEHCESQDGDFYHYFHFDGFDVCWGYASYDV